MQSFRISLKHKDSLHKNFNSKLINYKSTFGQPSKKLHIDYDHIEAVDPRAFDKLLEIGIVGDGDQGDA